MALGTISGEWLFAVFREPDLAQLVFHRILDSIWNKWLMDISAEGFIGHCKVFMFCRRELGL